GREGRRDGVRQRPGRLHRQDHAELRGGVLHHADAVEPPARVRPLDFKTGYRKLDGTTRVRCTFFGQVCRENFFPLEFDPKRIAGVQSNRSLVDFLIADAKFMKLREVSVVYTLPDAWATALRTSQATVSLAGRNLHTWTGYTGLDPEAMFLGGSRGGNFSQWEQ